MQLFDIKNDIAKILYTTNESHLLLADFLLIEDMNQSLIAQVIDIESADQPNTNVATVKFSLSINKSANLSTYNGYTPARDANIIYIDPKEIAQLIQSTGSNIYWGTLASHPDAEINLGLSLLREKTYIQCDKIENATIITSNILYSLQNQNKRTILIDFDGRYRKIENATRITVSKEYKLPLSYSAFDFISEHDLEDCSDANKAIIQGILLELQSYVETLPDGFIPFDLFKSVIDEQCRQNPIPELIIFKNKLVKYQQKALFAQKKDQFDFLNKLLTKTSITIIDATDIEEKWHRFIIETIASQIEKKSYFIVNLNDENSTKYTLNLIYENEKIRPIPVSGYKYGLLKHLKALNKNLILFAPIEKTNDFEIYESFLQKLNQKEFIIWSENTFFMPLILKLKAFTKDSFSPVVEDEIKEDVDRIFTAAQEEPGESLLNIKTQEKAEIVLDDEIFDSDVLEEKAILENDFDIQSGSDELELIEDIAEAQGTPYTAGVEEDASGAILIDDVTPDDLDFLDESSNLLPSEKKEEVVELTDNVTSEDLDFLDGQDSILLSEEVSDDVFLTQNEVEVANSIETQDPLKNVVSELQIDDSDDEVVVESDDDDDDDEEYVYSVATKQPEQPNVINVNFEEYNKQGGFSEPIEEPTVVQGVVAQKLAQASQELEKTAQAVKIPEPPKPTPIPKKPSVPIYEAKVEKRAADGTSFKEGNYVFHAKYGKGIVEKIITYGNKTLCSIQFDNVGRRLLDPTLANIQLV